MQRFQKQALTPKLRSRPSFDFVLFLILIFIPYSSLNLPLVPSSDHCGHSAPFIALRPKILGAQVICGAFISTAKAETSTTTATHSNQKSQLSQYPGVTLMAIKYYLLGRIRLGSEVVREKSSRGASRFIPTTRLPRGALSLLP